MPEANRNHKSSVFTTIFGVPDELIPLYNTVSGNNYPLNTPIEINTLENVLFKGRYNDLSFTIDKKLVVLIEHQSSINPNMPLRLFIYLSRVLEKLIDGDKIYSTNLIEIPHPELIVLYNGEDNFDDETTLKLSDAFVKIPDEMKHCGSLELEVKVLNINKGHNENILKQDKTLDEYAIFINEIRVNKANGLSLDEAVTLAVKNCSEKKILEKFLKEYGSEVLNMLTTEWNMEDYGRVQRQEGKLEAAIENAVKMIKKGFGFDDIKDITELPDDKLKPLFSQL